MTIIKCIYIILSVMEKTEKNTKFTALLALIKRALASKYLPFVTTAVVLLSHLLGLDIVLIYFYAIVGIAMILLLDDLTPLITHLLYLHVLVSYQNSPSPLVHNGNPEYYTNPVMIGFIAAIVAVLCGAAVWRIIKSRAKLRFNAMTLGFAVFSVTLLLNGIGSPNGYNPMTFFYGFALSLLFTLPYVLLSANITPSKENFIKVAWGFVALSVLLVIELATKYVTQWEHVVSDGSLEKGAFVFGWGMWNTMGMLLVLCIPSMFLLASTHKYGYLFILYATLLAGCAFFTTSRQSMLGAVIIYPLSAIVTIVCGKNRRFNIATLIAVAAVIGIIAIASWDDILHIFSSVFDNLFNDQGYDGSGRSYLLQLAWGYFKEAPVFGQGFYLSFPNDPGFAGMNGFIPLMAHNTYAELLATCGILGLLGYLAHRIITIICFLRNPTPERTFIALAVLSMLILCMFDNHIFYLLPTVAYSALSSLSTNSEVVIKLPLFKRKTSN